jgi:hypothetical protein
MCVPQNAQGHCGIMQGDGISLGALTGFIAKVTHAIGGNAFILVRIAEPFWFLTALVVSLPDCAEWHSLTVYPGSIPLGRPTYR